LQIEEFGINLGVQILEICVRWDHTSLNRQDGFDDTSETTASFQVTNI
jgi:hypothetical protein